MHLEREEKKQTASAVLKRRHIEHDVAHLKQCLERAHMAVDTPNDHGSDNQDLYQSVGEYHTKGWYPIKERDLWEPTVGSIKWITG